jgi:DNA polymerase I-like protein with 3'-5' exonuclease and polymerase domains
MIEAFINGEDLHAMIASIVLDKPEKDVTKTTGKRAKALRKAKIN